MGSSADDRLTERNIRKTAGHQFRFATEKEVAELSDNAEKLAVTDCMTLAQAVKIETGQTRPAYGTRKPLI